MQPTNKQTDKQTNKHATNFDNSADTLCCKTVLQDRRVLKRDEEANDCRNEP